MTRSLAIAVALSVALADGGFAAAPDANPGAVAAYEHYLDVALHNPAFSETTPDLHTMKITRMKAYSVCIGELLRETGCPTADYFFECDFADAHPSEAESAAARRICAEHASAQYAVQRITAYRGDRCGYIIDTVTCAF